MSEGLRSAAKLTRRQATTLFEGYILRDPMALLGLRPGRENPYPIYEQVRDRGPLSQTRHGNWVSASYGVCDAIMRDRQGAGAIPSTSELDDRSLLGMDPPDHTRLRRVIQPAFSPRAIAGYTRQIEKTVHDLLDMALRKETFDLVSDFSAPLPIAVISTLLGIPEVDARMFAYHGMILGSSLNGIRSVKHARQLQGSARYMRELFEGLIKARTYSPQDVKHSAPQDDLISKLTEGTDPTGVPVVPHEALMLCRLLLVAGFETTVNLISNCVLALLTHPGQWHLLCDNPTLAPLAVEETLRWDGPIQRVGRIALENMTLQGCDVRKGQYLGLLLAGANRDPAVYHNPGAFDITDSGRMPHLAFSTGIHGCVGRPLAVLEAGIAIQALAERMPLLSVAGKVQRRNSPIIRGPIHLPVRI